MLLSMYFLKLVTITYHTENKKTSKYNLRNITT